MFNPFKKKEEDFSLDDMNLPSLNDAGSTPSIPTTPTQTPNQTPNFEMPALPDLNNPIEASQQNQINQNQLDQSLEQTQGLSGLNQANATPNFDTNLQTPESQQTNTNPFATPNETINPQTSSGTIPNQEIHNKTTNVKIETLDSKMQLMDAKISRVEQKLDLILQLIQNEVSEETKMKVNIEQKMNNIRQ